MFYYTTTRRRRYAQYKMRAIVIDVPWSRAQFDMGPANASSLLLSFPPSCPSLALLLASGSLPFHYFFLFPTPVPFSPFLPLGPLKYSQGVWVSAVSFLSGVWGGAPAETEFGAF